MSFRIQNGLIATITACALGAAAFTLTSSPASAAARGGFGHSGGAVYAAHSGRHGFGGGGYGSGFNAGLFSAGVAAGIAATILDNLN